MNCLLSNILSCVISFSLICSFVKSDNRIKLAVYTTGIEETNSVFNVWKYAPDRDEGNGIPDYGDFLIAQGRPDEYGTIVWNEESDVLDLSNYGTGIYGINVIFENSTNYIDSNWICCDDSTFYRTFSIDSNDCYIELTCIGKYSIKQNQNKEEITPTIKARNNVNTTKTKSHELSKTINEVETSNKKNIDINVIKNLLSYLSLLASLLVLYYVITAKRAH